MTRPRLAPIPDEEVLSHMDSQSGITVRRLSHRLNIDDERVRKKMLELIARGKVRREREGTSTSSFYLYFTTYEKTSIAGGEFEIASPPMTPNMTGVLTGYEAEFRRRQELSMCARRQA